MQRDIDLIIEDLTANVRGIRIEQLKVKHPGADDDGLGFINIDDHREQAQIESSEGMCPFLIESASMMSGYTAIRSKKSLRRSNAFIR